MIILRVFLAIGAYLKFRFKQSPRLTGLLLGIGIVAFVLLKGWQVG